MVHQITTGEASRAKRASSNNYKKVAVSGLQRAKGVLTFCSHCTLFFCCNKIQLPCRLILIVVYSLICVHQTSGKLSTLAVSGSKRASSTANKAPVSAIKRAKGGPAFSKKMVRFLLVQSHFCDINISDHWNEELLCSQI